MVFKAFNFLHLLFTINMAYQVSGQFQVTTSMKRESIPTMKLAPTVKAAMTFVPLSVKMFVGDSSTSVKSCSFMVRLQVRNHLLNVQGKQVH